MSRIWRWITTPLKKWAGRKMELALRETRAITSSVEAEAELST